MPWPQLGTGGGCLAHPIVQNLPCLPETCCCDCYRRCLKGRHSYRGRYQTLWMPAATTLYLQTQKIMRGTCSGLKKVTRVAAEQSPFADDFARSDSCSRAPYWQVQMMRLGQEIGGRCSQGMMGSVAVFQRMSLGMRPPRRFQIWGSLLQAWLLICITCLRNEHPPALSSNPANRVTACSPHGSFSSFRDLKAFMGALPIGLSEPLLGPSS